MCPFNALHHRIFDMDAFQRANLWRKSIRTVNTTSFIKQHTRALVHSFAHFICKQEHCQHQQNHSLEKQRKKTNAKPAYVCSLDNILTSVSEAK